VKTSGEFIYQPVKVGVRDGRVFVEVHKDIYQQLPGPYREALRLIDKYGWRPHVDLDRVQRAVVEESGVPIDVTLDSTVNEVKDETLRSSPRRREAAGGGEPPQMR